MKAAPTLILLSLLPFITAYPITEWSSIIKRADPSDIQVLQFALTLEHLEDAFYKEFLPKFDQAAFDAAGFPPFVRGRLTQIGEHEAQHAIFLTKVLGSQATAPCTYTFPVTDAKSFVAVSEMLEGVGVTAYLGAAQFLKNPVFLTAAGSLLSTEARHNAWLNSASQHSYPWSGPMDTPQTINEVFSLASAFIKSCPSSNPQLPVKAFPPANVTVNGNEATVSFEWSDSNKDGLFLALLSGLTTKFAPIKDGKADLPTGLQGTVYAVVTKNGTTVTDDETVAGPAILQFQFDSNVPNLAPSA